jgi:large subunit ribosomal protein L25|tara:strand:+ start:74 stop:712 length:639 start_codon:yes stop_codon:yes gene_type:complete
MSTASLEGTLRKETGKRPTKQVRKEGNLPAVLYGLKDVLSLYVNPKELAKIVKQKGRNVVIDLTITSDSTASRKVMIKDSQRHPLRETWVHADFLELDTSKEVRVHIPVVLEGISPGEKKGGVLNHAIRIIDIDCLPDDIPEKITVSISQLEIGQAIHISDLNLPETYKVSNSASATVVLVQQEKRAVVKTAGEEEGADGVADPAQAEKKAE